MNLTEENNETDWNVDAIWQRAENPDVAPAFYIGSGIWLSIIFCIGVFCNGSVLYAYLKNSGVCIWSVPYYWVAAYIKVFTVSRCTLIGTIKLSTYVFGFPTKNIKYIYLIQSSKIPNDLLLVLLEVCTLQNISSHLWRFCWPLKRLLFCTQTTLTQLWTSVRVKILKEAFSCLSSYFESMLETT